MKYTTSNSNDRIAEMWKRHIRKPYSGGVGSGLVVFISLNTSVQVLTEIWKY